jgi:hypothetical protein
VIPQIKHSKKRFRLPVDPNAMNETETAQGNCAVSLEAIWFRIPFESVIGLWIKSAGEKQDLRRGILKIISGGQTGVDRGALDAALAFEVECGGWCPAGRLAEDGTIPKCYPVMELANAGYAERTARNVADSDGTLVISKGEPIGGTRETIDRCIEMRKPYRVIDCASISVQETIEAATEFVRALSFRVAQTAPVRLGPRNLSSVHKRMGQLRGPSHSLGMTIVLNVAGPRASQWSEGHQTALQIVSSILRRLVDRTTPVNTVRDSPSGDP